MKSTNNQKETSKTKTGFVYNGRNEDYNSPFGLEDGDLFTAKFPLTDDGTPGSERFLRIEVLTCEEENSAVVLSIEPVKIDPMTKPKIIGRFQTDNLTAISDLLYGAARLVTVKKIQPV